MHWKKVKKSRQIEAFQPFPKKRARIPRWDQRNLSLSNKNSFLGSEVRFGHTMEGTLNAEHQLTDNGPNASRNAFSFSQPAAGAGFLAFLGINDA